MFLTFKSALRIKKSVWGVIDKVLCYILKSLEMFL